MLMISSGTLCETTQGISLYKTSGNVLDECRVWVDVGEQVLLLEHVVVETGIRYSTVRLLTAKAFVGYLDVWDWENVECILKPVNAEPCNNS